MPIVIVKGSDGTKKKQLLKCSSSDELLLNADTSVECGLTSPIVKRDRTIVKPATDRDEVKYDNKQCIVGDMTDILDFKLYRITKPNFYEPVSKTILVGGEFFYNKEELNKVLRTDGEEEEVDKMPPIVNNKPTVLQKIRQMKYTTKKMNILNRNQKDILEHVKDATDRTKLVKSGHSLTASLEIPTAEMTVEWAVHYVNVNETDLVDSFVNLDAKLKEFELSLRHHSPLSRFAADSAVNGGDDIGTTHVKGEFASRRREGNNNPQAHRNAVNANNTTSKPPSLAAQLDNIKNSGTEAFVNNITIAPPVVPTPPAARRSVDISHMPPHLQRRSSKLVHGGSSMGDSFGVQQTLSTISEPGNKASLSHQSIPRKIVSSSHPNHDSGDESGGRRTSRSNNTSQELLRNIVPISPAGPAAPQSPLTKPRGRTRTLSNLEVSADEGEDDIVPEAIRSPSPISAKMSASGKKVKIKRMESPAPPRQLKPGRVYTNVFVEPPAQNQNPGLNNSTKDTIQELMLTQKIFQQSISFASSVFESTTSKNQKLQEVIDKKLKRGNRGGQRIVKQWLSFRNIKSKQSQNVNETCQTKEFFRANDMLENIGCFQMEGYDRNNASNKLGVNAAKDIKYMRKNAQLSSYNKIMTRLFATKWFCVIVTKIRDYMRRMNNNIPICCLKFLTVFQYLLSYEYPLTTALFYHILESTVVIREDHIRNIVHMVIRAARDALGITPHEFLSYLESKNIQPCPELLNQIRALNAVHSTSNSRVHSPTARQSIHSAEHHHGGILQDNDDDSKAVAVAAGVVGQQDIISEFATIDNGASNVEISFDGLTPRRDGLLQSDFFDSNNNEQHSHVHFMEAATVLKDEV